MWTGVDSTLHLMRISLAMLPTIEGGTKSMILSAHLISLFNFLKGATKSTFFLCIPMILFNLSGW